MPLNTVTAAVHIAPGMTLLYLGPSDRSDHVPAAIKTFFKHYKRKASKFKDGNTEEESTDDVLYDE